MADGKRESKLKDRSSPRHLSRSLESARAGRQNQQDQRQPGSEVKRWPVQNPWRLGKLQDGMERNGAWMRGTRFDFDSKYPTQIAHLRETSESSLSSDIQNSRWEGTPKLSLGESEGSRALQHRFSAVAKCTFCRLYFRIAFFGLSTHFTLFIRKGGCKSSWSYQKWYKLVHSKRCGVIQRRNSGRKDQKEERRAIWVRWYIHHPMVIERMWLETKPSMHEGVSWGKFTPEVAVTGSGSGLKTVCPLHSWIRNLSVFYKAVLTDESGQQSDAQAPLSVISWYDVRSVCRTAKIRTYISLPSELFSSPSS